MRRASTKHLSASPYRPSFSCASPASIRAAATASSSRPCCFLALFTFLSSRARHMFLCDGQSATWHSLQQYCTCLQGHLAEESGAPHFAHSLGFSTRSAIPFLSCLCWKVPCPLSLDQPLM